MSIREARLCDHAKCNNPAVAACELCNRDCCAGHVAERGLYIVVVHRPKDANATEHLGKTEHTLLCRDCDEQIYRHTVALTHNPVATAFHDLVAPLRAQLVQTAAAFLAAQKLEKKPG